MNPADTRLIFMGTPDFAVPSLQRLISDGVRIPAVVTNPDKPGGRGQKLRAPAVKKAAEEANLPVLQPERLDDADFLAKLRELDPQLIIVVAFRLLPEAIWKLPEKGTINLHASLLPHYRGAAPINRVLMNGEDRSGVSTFLIRKEMDAGDLLYRKEVPLHEDMTAGELHDTLMERGAELLSTTIRDFLSGTLEPVPQESYLDPGESPKKAPKIQRPDRLIDWQQDARQVHDRIRGLSPFPGALTELYRGDGSAPVTVKLLISTVKNEKTSDLAPGGIHPRESPTPHLEVGTGQGSIAVKRLQQEGKKALDAASFLRGTPLSEKAYFTQPGEGIH